MGSSDNLERFSAAFAEFMTPDETGEPLMLTSDLKHALQQVDIEPALYREIQPLMDPESTGKITFEKFVSVCEGLLGEDGSPGADSPSNEEKHTQSQRKHNETANEEMIEDSDAESDMEAGFIPEDADDDEDEDYKDPDVDTDMQQAASDSASIERVFDLLSQGNANISVASLEHASRLININVPRSDLEKMTDRVSTKEEFRRLWRKLEKPA